MKVIVTGSNGFLGHWLVKRLSEEGLDVHALVRKGSSVDELKGLRYTLTEGDVCNPESLVKAFADAHTVFHLAGLIAYKKSDRAQMESVNVQGTANVIEACKRNKVNTLFHLSSVVAVGAGFTKYDILNEDSTYNISNLDLGYFETKRKAEELAIKAFHRGDCDVKIVNPSTIYGFADAKKGSRKMQVKVARGELKFYTPGGVNVVAVEDVIDGILSCWKKGRSAERYILSSDNLTIKELFQMIAKEAGVAEPRYELPGWLLHTAGITGDILNKFGYGFPLSQENAWTSTLFHWFDNSKAKAELGFSPRPSVKAIHNSVQWMKENHYLD
jgi:dihydroflavonol-4-reductase